VRLLFGHAQKHRTTPGNPDSKRKDVATAWPHFEPVRA